MTDEVLLHTILFASALHLHNVSDSHDFKDASLLMKVILDRLNRRLRNKTLSDATIGAVSCLAMCEVRPRHEPCDILALITAEYCWQA